MSGDMSIIAALGRLKQEDHLSPGVWDQPGQHKETLKQKQNPNSRKDVSE
jgi:hypothetical protein